MDTFEIRVRGIVSESFAAQMLDGVAVRYESVLVGALDDQDVLLDLIERLYALGVEVVDAQRVRSPAGL